MKLIKTIAMLVSILFHPMLIPTYTMILFRYACYSISDVQQSLTNSYANGYFLLLIFGTLLFTLIIPFSVILLLIKQGELKNAYIEQRETRNIPYLYSILSAIIWCYFLWHIMHLQDFIIIMAVGATLALVAVGIINHWWKISAHMSCFGTLIGSVAGWTWNTGQYSLWFLPILFILALILMYSRLYLKAHTPMQLVVGLLLGISFTYLPVVFYNLL